MLRSEFPAFRWAEFWSYWGRKYILSNSRYVALLGVRLVATSSIWLILCDLAGKISPKYADTISSIFPQSGSAMPTVRKKSPKSPDVRKKYSAPDTSIWSGTSLWPACIYAGRHRYISPSVISKSGPLLYIDRMRSYWVRFLNVASFRRNRTRSSRTFRISSQNLHISILILQITEIE